MKRNFNMQIAVLILCSSAFVLSAVANTNKNDPSFVKWILGPGQPPGATVDGGPSELPARYFWLMDSFSDSVDAQLKANPDITLEEMDKYFHSRHSPFAILGPAVLYAKKHSSNKRYRDPRMLALAIRIGDMMAAESAKKDYEARGDSDWEIYLWLEAYRLLQHELGEERKTLWKQEIIANVSLLEKKCMERIDFAWYNTPYTGTSPNHYSIYAAIIYLAGNVFDNEHWQTIGAHILKRFAIEEQTPDGYWGELVRSSATIGYNHLTLSSVALYWEHSHDKSVLPALRRALDFHKYFTYPNGEDVEVMNDRNRHGGVSPWAQFAFTNFPDGRRFAQFLAGFFNPDNMNVDLLGRMAQNALYCHEGAQKPIPQDQQHYSYRLQTEAGISKKAPWIIALSGMLSPQAILNQFYLDRQGNLSIFHEKLGQIISGANSKRQPELATFREKLSGQFHTVPMSSRLQMSADTNRLSLAYNTFFADLFVPVPSEKELPFRFVISGVGRPSEESALTLQLCLKAGKTLETATGKKIILSEELVELSPKDIGGWIKHNGWTLKVDPSTSLTWPVYPFNPYADKPETSLSSAVGALSVPLKLKEVSGRYVRPDEQEISFLLKTD